MESIQLPVMSQSEAKEFLKELLTAHRCEGAEDPYLPFTESSVDAILGKVAKLTPRQIMKYFDVVLRHGDEDIEDGTITNITPDYALRVLQETPIAEDDET